MRARGISYGLWFLAAVGLHACALFAWGRLTDVPEYSVAAGGELEVTLVEAAPEVVAQSVADATPPEPEEPPPEEMEPPPPKEVPAPEAPPVVEEPEPKEIPTETSMIVPFPTPPSTPPPARRVTRTPKRTEISVAPARTGGAPSPKGVTTTAKPHYLNNPAPTYPAASRAAREEGVVILEVAVTEQGRAASVRLHRSSGHSRLDEAAISAVERWRFSPARVGGIAVSTEVHVPVRFRLD